MFTTTDQIKKHVDKLIAESKKIQQRAFFLEVSTELFNTKFQGAVRTKLGISDNHESLIVGYKGHSLVLREKK